MNEFYEEVAAELDRERNQAQRPIHRAIGCFFWGMIALLVLAGIGIGAIVG